MAFLYFIVLFLFFILYFFFKGDLELCDPSDVSLSPQDMDDDGGKVVIVGVCAMEKKTQSKPMKEILTRLQEFEYIKVIVFEEEVIIQVSNYKTINIVKK